MRAARSSLCIFVVGVLGFLAGLAPEVVGQVSGQVSGQGEPPDAQSGESRGEAALDRETRVERLTERGDAGRDDWESEVFAQRASDALHELLDELALDAGLDEGLDLAPWVLAGASSDALAPVGGRTRNLGDLVVRRVALPLPPEQAEPVALPEALRAWLAPLRQHGAPRVDFKMVGVELGGLDRTRLLVTLSGTAADGSVVQHNAIWLATWADDEGASKLASISLEGFEEVRAPAPLFEDWTGSVLPQDSELRLQLARGGEHWFGRIDAVGEWNFFGHNGIAVGDVNGDLLDDVYVAMGTGLPNKLLVRQADGTVRDMALQAGAAWLDDTKGVLFANYDNDGDQDLFCAIGPTIVLSENDGSGVLTPARSMRAGTDSSFYSLAAADFDLDGDLDLFALRYVQTRYGESIPKPFHDARNGPRNHLLRNDFPDGFTDVTDRVGLGVDNDRFSLAASWEDYDLDGDPDLYVANDFGRNNLYRNDGGTFVNVAAEAGVEDMSAGMGVSWADVDQDGDADLLVSNMFSAAGQRVAYQPRFEAERDDTAADIQRHSLGNSLLVNEGDGRFRDASASAGIRMGRWAWGARLVDFTGDGMPDMTVPNGFLTNDHKDDL